MEEKKYFLNPLSILIFMMFSSVLAFLSSDKIFVCLILLAFTIEFILKREKFIKSLLLFVIIYLVAVNQIFMHFGFWGSSLHIMVFVIYRLMPLIILSTAMTGFTSTELMSAFRKLNFPERVCLAISVFFRFLPEFRQRMFDIRLGAKIRGLKISLFHPLKSLELFLVPMIYKGLSVSDSITAAIITKGIEYEGKKTNYRNIGFTLNDMAFFLMEMILIGVAIWEKM